MAKDKNTADVGFEEKLWQMADKMRNNMEIFSNHIQTLKKIRNELISKLMNVEIDMETQLPQ